MSKKGLIVVTSHAELGNTGKKTGYYLPEVTHPYFALTERGFEVDIVSPKGGTPPMDEKSHDLSDPMNKNFLNSHQTALKLQNTLTPKQVLASNYDAIIFAGGHGTMWDFSDNADLAQLASDIYEKGGVVAALCHGPAALLNLKLADGSYLVSGKELTAFSNDEEAAAELSEVMPFLLETELVKRGARYSKAPVWQKHVVVSERLITGQNPASGYAVGEAVAKLVESSM